MRNERVEKYIPEMVFNLNKFQGIMVRTSKICDYLFVLRPTLFFPVWTVYAAGFFSAKRFLPLALQVDNSGWGLAVGIALSLLMGSAFILNQIVDVTTDKLNNKLFLIADGHIPMVIAIFETVLLGIVPLVIVAVFSWMMVLIFVAIYLVTGLLYSLPLFKWKDKPLLGIVANAGGAFLIFSAGWWVKDISFVQPIIHAIPYAAAVAAVYIFTTVVDETGDAQCDKNTFAVKYGFKAVIWAGFCFELVALYSAWLLNDPLIFYPALLAFPFFILAAKKQSMTEVIRAIKFPILLLSLAICVLLPNYFLLLAVTYYLSKWYYYYRFGLHYPSLEAK
ncbi:MAG: hypothetical protein DWQ05_20005 [Calditrichaeota bacterium]|nr:MAG: hypothetical protein DWQ05_20005 [Calditrichota bacterium]